MQVTWSGCITWTNFCNKYYSWFPPAPIMQTGEFLRVFSISRDGKYCFVPTIESYCGLTNYIKVWLEISQLPSGVVSRLLLFYQDPASLKLTADESVLYQYLTMSLDLENLQNNSHLFKSLLNVVADHFAFQRSYGKLEGILELILEFDRSQSIDFFTYMWATEIFKCLSNFSSTYVIDLEAPIEYRCKNPTVGLLAEIVELVSNTILTKISLLWGVNKINKLYNKDLVIKSSLLDIFYQLSEEYSGSHFIVYTKNIKEVFKLNQQQFKKLCGLITGDLLNQNLDPVSVVFEEKLKLVAIDFFFKPNIKSLLKILPTPCKIIERDGVF